MSIGSIFNNVAHGIAWFAKKTVSFARVSESVAAKVAELAPEIEAVTKLISPQAAALEDLAFRVLGAYGAAALAVDGAVSANGLNVPLDQAAHDQVVAFVRMINDNVAAGLKKP